MNIQQGCNNVVSVTNSNKKVTTVNGVEYPWIKGMRGNNITQINGKIYIDGYELKEGEWKRTIKGLFHLFF